MSIVISVSDAWLSGNMRSGSASRIAVVIKATPADKMRRERNRSSKVDRVGEPPGKGDGDGPREESRCCVDEDAEGGSEDDAVDHANSHTSAPL